MGLSRTQINQLGDRLRAGPFTDSDRELLLEYRASFLPAYRHVVESIRIRLGIEPTGRPEKTPESIIAKLRRTKIELGRMQDIAGCRITVDDIPEQHRALVRIIELFPAARVVDRRIEPSHGYRAVHLIPSVENVTVEIQLRTAKQDFWAAISEYMADQLGVELKYGGTPKGAEMARRLLDWSSSAIADLEVDEAARGKSYGREFNLGEAAAIMRVAAREVGLK
jgi:ppGpp synthetase/RelA/SpoT-type nucleotidyltranferase